MYVIYICTYEEAINSTRPILTPCIWGQMRKEAIILARQLTSITILSRTIFTDEAGKNMNAIWLMHLSGSCYFPVPYNCEWACIQEWPEKGVMAKGSEVMKHPCLFCDSHSSLKSYLVVFIVVNHPIIIKLPLKTMSVPFLGFLVSDIMTKHFYTSGGTVSARSVVASLWHLCHSQLFDITDRFRRFIVIVIDTDPYIPI